MMHPATLVAAAPEGPVRAAAEADTHHVLDTITLGFAADPVVRWVFPDEQQYLRYFPRFAKAFGGAAIPLGTAFVSEGIAGAALWLPPDEASDEEAMMAVMEDAIPAERQEEISGLFEGLEAYHPHEPHWYLPLIGVRPDRQGEGHGSALLAHALGLCDEAGLPAYLEATSERNAALYRRHGFEPMGEIRVPGSPVLTPMLRPAR